MAYQNTNAIAKQQLRPLENNDIGAIVEEHVRYWRKYKDDQEAKDLERKAKNKEFNRKVAKDRKAELPKLNLQDTEPYFNAQYLDYYKNTLAPEYHKLAKEYEKTGDPEIIVKLDLLTNKAKQYGEIKGEYQKRASEILKAKEDGTYNPYIDKEQADLILSVGQGSYTIKDDTGKIGVWNENPKEDEPALKFYEPFDFKANVLKPMSFSGMPKWEEEAKDITGLIKIPVINGEVKATKENYREALDLRKSQWQKNPLSLRTWAGANGFSTDIEDLSDADVNLLAQSWNDKYVFFDEKRNPLDIAGKKASNYGKFLDNKKKKKASEKHVEGISIATNVKGKPIKTTRGGTTGNSFVVNLPKTKQFITQTKDGKVNVISARILDGGNIEFSGNIVETENVVLSDGFETEKVKKVIRPYRIDDKEEVNSVVKMIPIGDVQGNTYDNASDFYNDAKSKYNEIVNGSNNSTNNETKEEKKARLRKIAGIE